MGYSICIQTTPLLSIMTSIRKCYIQYYAITLKLITYTLYCRSNILLDKNWRGYLSDFGFSIQLPPKKANKTVVTAIDALPGTDGYRPPEYSDGKFSTLSDIYCMGVVRFYSLNIVYRGFDYIPLL